jgi:Protein of unknown function (DUF992)
VTTFKWNSLIGIASIVLTVALVPSVFAQAGTAQDKSEIKVGYLSCHQASGWGLIFGSSRELDCIFTPTSGEPETYKGEINKFGADIGYLQSAVILWTVLAPSTTTGKGALAGHYAGATASATLGIGAAAHVLVGGMHSSLALQPISIEGNTGLNVAAGIATLNLDYVMPAHAHEQQ